MRHIALVVLEWSSIAAAGSLLLALAVYWYEKRHPMK